MDDWAVAPLTYQAWQSRTWPAATRLLLQAGNTLNPVTGPTRSDGGDGTAGRAVLQHVLEDQLRGPTLRLLNSAAPRAPGAAVMSGVNCRSCQQLVSHIIFMQLRASIEREAL